MDYTNFGNTGMQVSRLTLGAMTFTSALSEKESARVIDEALDHGVNFVDTADSYGPSEEALGRLLEGGKRERVYLTSKVYKRFCRDGRAGRNSRVNILHNIEQSLRLLRTDYLDLYQLHHPDPDTPVEETLQTLDTLVRQGKIRHWGVSNHYAWQMAYMLGLTRERRLEPMVSVQSWYSILDRQIEREIVPMIDRFNIALMAYSPLSGGILTGKYHPREGEPASGRANHGKLQKRLEDETVSKIVRTLRSLAESQGLEMNQLAISWLLSKPHVTTVILGGTKPEHFTPIYEIAERKLPDDVIQEIDAVSAPTEFSEFMNQPQRAGAPLNPNG